MKASLFSIFAWATNNIRSHPFTWFVMALCILPFYLYQFGQLINMLPWFLPTEATLKILDPKALWRLWAPTFVHVSWHHIIVNFLMWWYFATRLERYSRYQLIFLTFVTALFGNLCQWVLGNSLFGGLSGVIFGVAGYIWAMDKFSGLSLFPFSDSLMILILVVMLISTTGLLGQSADWAHAGGLVAGIVYALAQLKLNDKPKNANYHKDKP